MSKEPSIKERVIKALQEHGPMKVEQMTDYVKGVEKTSIHSKCLELLHDKQLTRSDMVWALAEEVGDKGEDGDNGEDKGQAAVKPEMGKPLDPKGVFENQLKSVGVKADVIPTISYVFFNGDVTNLKWLQQVLVRQAAGFVTANQVRLVIAGWSAVQGLPFDPEDYPFESTESTKGARELAKESTKPLGAQVLEDAGIGWKVGKDADGDWVPQPGGVMTYQDALNSAERRAAIAAMNMGSTDNTAEETAAGSGTRSTSKGGRASKSFQDTLMEKIVDDWIDGKHGKGDEDSPAIKALSQQLEKATSTIEQMRDDKAQERLDRIEQNLSVIASRDPWTDPVEVARARAVLGVQTSGVTDASPAVQLIKDSTEKVDKNMNRLVGIVEQIALKTDQFRPEETRTPAEKEAKAGALLDEATKRTRSKELRQRTFGT